MIKDELVLCTEKIIDIKEFLYDGDDFVAHED